MVAIAATATNFINFFVEFIYLLFNDLGHKALLAWLIGELLLLHLDLFLDGGGYCLLVVTTDSYLIE